MLPAMLDVVATGNMPKDDQMRPIAAPYRDRQAQACRTYKPKIRSNRSCERG
jgi:hypothetical protein